MSLKILLNASTPEVRAVLTSRGRAIEYHIERPGSRGIVGNIYRAKVLRVLPGMQAAFLDLGKSVARSGYIHVSDLLGAQDDPSIKIDKALKAGQWVTVQVAKGPIGDKGARVTEQVALPGRLSVFLPFSDHIGVSKRITSEGLRKKMRGWIDEYRPEGTGVIVRTAAEKASEEEIRDDLSYLVKVWQQVSKKSKSQKAPGVVYEDLDLPKRIVRDMLRDDVDKIMVDSKEQFDEVVAFAQEFLPRFVKKIELYESDVPIFLQYKVASDVNNIAKREVSLKSGGALVIDTGEALTSIDVNTKSFIGKKSASLEDTVTANNLEACEEVARQLRLRNIGGIIVVDFVDMDDRENREKVWDAFHKALEKDNTKTNITRISELGLVEMTRKRNRESISQLLNETCPTCAGLGSVPTIETLAYGSLRKLREKASKTSDKMLVLSVPRGQRQFIEKQERSYLQFLATTYQKGIEVKDGNFKIESEKAVRSGKSVIQPNSKSASKPSPKKSQAKSAGSRSSNSVKEKKADSKNGEKRRKQRANPPRSQP